MDIIIGTHRLLSKDVEFKNLGLLVVDEEQRFGVTHKEKIKKIKENVDVLTLTATPIPRTMHMSLIGIRDMSLLEEAPVDRQQIQTYVMEYNDEMVRQGADRFIMCITESMALRKLPQILQSWCRMQLSLMPMDR